MELSVQTKNIVRDENPEEGFRLMKAAGFSAADFSLNQYLLNLDIYEQRINGFFSQSLDELEHFFTPHRDGARAAGVRIGQMHMPYPAYVPQGRDDLNAFLWQEMAPKSMALAGFLHCPYIVIHGFKLSHFLGSEEAEWAQTERFIDSLAPLAIENHTTICIENLYDGLGGHMIEGPCCDARKAAERIDRINGKYGEEVLGFCLDTGHANLVGIDFLDFIRTLGSRLKVLHIHDNDGLSDLHQIPFTFARTRENKSSTDWAGFLQGLREIQYQGTLNFETAPVLTAFPSEMQVDVLSFLAQIGNYFADKLGRKGAYESDGPFERSM